MRDKDRRVAGVCVSGGCGEHVAPSGQGLDDALAAIIEGQPDIADAACQRFLRYCGVWPDSLNDLVLAGRPAGTLDKVGQHIEALRAQLYGAIAGTQRPPRQIQRKAFKPEHLLSDCGHLPLLVAGTAASSKFHTISAALHGGFQDTRPPTVLSCHADVAAEHWEDAMHTLSRRAALAGLAFFALWPGPADAQEPTLKIVFPFSAGSSADAVARMLADHLQKRLARPVIVENRPGAGARIGLRAVKDAAPDGATLLL